MKLSVNELTGFWATNCGTIQLVLFQNLPLHPKSYLAFRETGPGGRCSTVPMVNGPGKLSPFTLKIEVSIVLHHFIMLEMQNYWNLNLYCKRRQLTGPVNYRDFRETGPRPDLKNKLPGRSLEIIVSFVFIILSFYLQNSILNVNKNSCLGPVIIRTFEKQTTGGPRYANVKATDTVSLLLLNSYSWWK